MKENDIGNDGWLSSLGWAGANTIKAGREISDGCSTGFTDLHASPHEAVVWIGSCSPDTTAKTDQGGRNQHGTPTKACLNRNPNEISLLWDLQNAENQLPDKVAKTKYKYCYTGELHNTWKCWVKRLDIIAEHRCLHLQSVFAPHKKIEGINQCQRTHSLSKRY